MTKLACCTYWHIVASDQRWDVWVVHKLLGRAAVTDGGGAGRRFERPLPGSVARHDVGDVDGGAFTGVHLQDLRNLPVETSTRKTTEFVERREAESLFPQRAS